MEKVFNFLRDNKELAFATVEGNKPKIRVFQIMKQEGTNLYFSTAPHKAVYKQLITNPNVELLAMRDNISVRIDGEAVFGIEDSMCQEIYNENPVLIRLYPDYKSLVYFRISINSIDYFDVVPTPPTMEHFQL